MGWGGQSGHMIAGIFYRTDGYDTNTPSIAVYADLYVQSVAWGYSNDTQNLNYWGQLGSGNIGYSMSSPSGTSTQKFVGTIAVGGQGQNYGGGPTYGVGVQVSGAYDGSAPSHTEYFNLPPRPPNTPTPPGLGVDSVGVNSARIVVSASDPRGSTVGAYEAYVCSNNAYPGSGGVVVASASGGTFVATGLAASTTYYAFSRALNGVGWSGWAGAVAFATSGNPPATMAVPTVGTITTTGATTTFVAPSNGGSPITQYQIQYADDNLFNSASGAVTYTMNQAGGGSHVYTGAGPGTRKWVRTRAINGVGAGGWSSPGVLITTTQTVPTITAPAEGAVVTSGAAAATVYAPGLRTDRTLRVQWSKDNTFATGITEVTHSPSSPSGTESYSVTHPTAYLSNGTWYIRARIENAETGVNTAYSATRTITQSHAPAATAGAPSGGTYRVYEATVPFTFVANDPAPSDSLTAYQIVVERNDTGAVVADSGKVASAFNQSTSKMVSLAISSTVKDIALRWKVRVWDLSDTVSSYSANSIFYLVDLPAVTITAPTGTVNVGSPLITWTFAATSGRTQSRADIKITQNDTGAVAYENWTNDPSARSMTPLMTILQNSKTYTISVKVRDSQGLENTVTSTFTSSFDPPAIIDYTVSSPDIDNLGYVIVDWSNAVADPSLVAWRVYRRELSSPTWELQAEYTDQSVTQYKDFLVCSYQSYLYNVTQVANRFGTDLESPIGLVQKSVVAPQRTNQLANPAGAAGGTTWTVNAGGLATVSTGPALGPFATSARATRALAGAVRFSQRAPSYAPSTIYTVRLTMRASEALSAVQVTMRPDVNSATGQLVMGTINVPAGESEVVLTGSTTATAATGTAGLAFVYSSGAVASTLDVVATLEVGVDVLNHFSGSVSPDLLNFTPAWTGSAGASTSTLTEVPYMQESRILEILLSTYWIVVPDVPELSTQMTGVKDDQSTLQFETATYGVIGRGRHRDYGDRLGYAGSLTVTVRGQDGTSAMRLKVEQMREADELYWLRTPFGKLFPIALGDIGWSPLAGVGAAEMGELTVPYEEVGL